MVRQVQKNMICAITVVIKLAAPAALAFRESSEIYACL